MTVAFEILLITDNLHYLIKPANFIFSFEATSFFYYKLERICRAIASQFIINYYKLANIGAALGEYPVFAGKYADTAF